MQQRGKNPYRYVDEDDNGEDIDEEDHAPHINLIRFGRVNENREFRYGDRVDNNLSNIFHIICHINNKVCSMIIELF